MHNPDSQSRKSSHVPRPARTTPTLDHCAAAIYQVQPKSALFKLPALQNPDVRSWMSSVFPVDLKRLKDSEKDSEKEPLDLARIQNEALRLSLEEVRVQLVQQTRILERMEQKFERRTAVFSPAKGYSNEAYVRSDDNPFVVHTHAQILDPPSTIDAETRACEDTGLYEADDNSLRAFFCASLARKNFGSAFEKSQNGLRPKQASIQSLQRLKLANWRHRNHLAKRSADEHSGKTFDRAAQAAAATVGTTGPIDGSDNLTSGNGDGAEVTSSSTIPAKRKAPIASRAKSAKFPKRK
ncbi:hypothetical protein C8J57DRAFT_1238668 [Mycena rebaudengoi]|nr:hypothetical protein C8J57DRAFT_1238668 [Mycena rebaudengoi]